MTAIAVLRLAALQPPERADHAVVIHSRGSGRRVRMIEPSAGPDIGRKLETFQV
jgi:hypothetical protein